MWGGVVGLTSIPVYQIQFTLNSVLISSKHYSPLFGKPQKGEKGGDCVHEIDCTQNNEAHLENCL